MRLGIGGDLVVDPVEASLASPQRPDGDRPAARRAHPARRRRACRSRPSPSRWGANADSTAFRFRARPEAHLRQRPAGHARGRHRLARAGHRDGRHVARRAVAGGGHRLPGLRRGRGRPRQRAHGPDLPRPSASSSRPPCRCCRRCCRARCSRWSTPRSIDGDDLGALDLSGDWAVASADDDVLTVERRDGAPGSLGGRGAAAVRRRRGGLRRASRRRTSTGPACRRHATRRRSTTTATTPSLRSRPSCSSA